MVLDALRAALGQLDAAVADRAAQPVAQGVDGRALVVAGDGGVDHRQQLAATREFEGEHRGTGGQDPAAILRPRQFPAHMARANASALRGGSCEAPCVIVLIAQQASSSLALAGDFSTPTIRSICGPL